jgi:hypothetical protein
MNDTLIIKITVMDLAQNFIESRIGVSPRANDKSIIFSSEEGLVHFSNR